MESSARIIIGFEVTNRKKEPFERLPSAELAGETFKSSLKETYDRLRKFEGLSCLRPSPKFERLSAQSNDISGMIDEICSDPSLLGKIRMVISEDELMFENVPSNERGMFLMTGGRTPLFESDPSDGTKFKVKIRSWWMARFIFDYFAEIYVANAIPAISRYLEQDGNSLASLYKKKDEFIKRDSFANKLPDPMQSGESPMAYANFFNTARETREFHSREVITRACLLWDRFILKSLSDHVSDKQSVLTDIKRWKGVSGRIPKTKVVERLKERGPGSYLLVKQKRSAQIRSQESNEKRMYTLIGEGLPIGRSNLSKGLAIYETNKPHPLLDWAIDSNFAQVFRIWIT